MHNVARTFLYILSFLPLLSTAQVPRDSELFRSMKIQDSIFFERGFNRCDFEYLEQATSTDLRFYHDTGGFQDRNEFLEASRKNLCGDPELKPIRKVREASLEVFPLYEHGVLYGVIQKGIHDFFLRRPGQKEEWTGTARFTSVWMREGTKWKLDEVLSYDHTPPKQAQLIAAAPDIEALLEKHQVPAVAFARLDQGRLRETRVVGELHEGVPAGMDAVFNVASLTKPILTMLTLRLAEAGGLDLDSPVHPWWIDPDVKDDPRSRQLTFRHILSHQTGFPNWRWEAEDDRLRFQYDPGKGYGYSGEGFEYLKKSLEKKYGLPIETLADSLLFSPLGMQHTRFTWDDKVNRENFARWHDEQGKNTYPTVEHQTASGADDLLTTISDYGRFAKYVLLKAQQGGGHYEEMIRRQNSLDSKTAMGLGFEILPGLEGEQYALIHTGGDIGVNTLLMLLPETGEGLVVFTNGDKGRQLFVPLIKEYLSLGNKIMESAQ